MQLLGMGLVKCSGCGAVSFLQNGELKLVADYGAVLTPEAIPDVFENMERELG